MPCYVARRLLQMALVFLGATLLIYATVFALPGDPIAALGGQCSLGPEMIDQVKAGYHLDKLFIVQYLLYLKGLLTLDLDQSLRGTESILDMLVRAYPITIKLSFMAPAFEAIVGIDFGLIARVGEGGWFDATILMLSLVVIAVPTFAIGSVLRFIVGVHLGRPPMTAGGSPGFTEFPMPAVVLGAASFVCILHLIRTEVAENLTAGHVRTARAKGLSGARVVIVHVLRNPLVPVVAFLDADLGVLMGGAIVAEGIFNIRGIRDILYSIIIRSDGPMIVSLTIVLMLVPTASNLLVDLLYAVLDPRTRYT